MEDPVVLTDDHSLWQEEPLERTPAEQLAGVLKVLASPTRLRIVSLIASHPEWSMYVGRLTDPLGLTQPTVSHHLRMLRLAGVVERERRGVFHVYRLVPGTLKVIAGLLTPSKKAMRQAQRPA